MTTTIARHGKASALFLVLAALLALVAFRAGGVSAQNGPDFVVPLSGAEEVPPVETESTGLFTATLTEAGLEYTLEATGPDGTEWAQAHIHLGAAGENGGVVAFLYLLEEVADPSAAFEASGTVTADDLIGDLEGNWDGFLAALATSNLYVNVHSSAFPPGEIRGQIDVSYETTLSGAAEVPPIETEAEGFFSASYNAATETLDYHLTANGSEWAQAHIHLAPAGENGDVVAFLYLLEEGAEPETSIDVTGSIGADDLIGPLEGDWEGFLVALATGNAYVNVHSNAFPPGEVRGQIGFATDGDVVEDPDYSIGLTGAEEVPPVETEATGEFHLTLGEGHVHYELLASGAEWLQAHIHLGPAGENGGVIAFLFGPVAEGEDPPTEIEVVGTITVDDLIGDLEGDWEGFEAALAEGLLYVNVHSVAYPSGEVRGQIVPETSEPEPTPTAEPTEEPTAEPTEEPTAAPTEEPTVAPTEEPTVAPTEAPTTAPTEAPAATPTTAPPAPPDAGSGPVPTSGPMVAAWMLALLGLAAIGFGASTLYAVHRR